MKSTRGMGWKNWLLLVLLVANLGLLLASHRMDLAMDAKLTQMAAERVQIEAARSQTLEAKR